VPEGRAQKSAAETGKFTAEVRRLKRIAVVTGASSGLGREYVKLLDERLAAHPEEKLDEIWVIARRRDRLEALQMRRQDPAEGDPA
jgi:short-subunit dehydrogenase